MIAYPLWGMKLKKHLFIFFYIFLCLALFIVSNVEIEKLLQMPSEIYSSYGEICDVNKDRLFGSLVKLDSIDNGLSTDNNNEEGVAIFKLFGFIPIKKVKIKYIPEEEVYVGGMPIGLTVNTEGAVVVSDSSVDVKTSKVTKNEVLKNGDIITKVNDKKIENLNEISEYLNEDSDEATVEFKRNGKTKTCKLPIIKDSSGNYKLGVWVKDDISGIGTLTFVRKSDNAFGALGHPITNGKDNNVISIKDGQIYNCTLVSINKGEKGDPGELRCAFVPKNPLGEIEQNTNYGIYGNLNDLNIVDTNLSYPIGGRLGVRCGSAKIVSYISGIKEEYEIEIIKANYQNSVSDKSMVFRVKDKRLLDLTGGIIQGMSGSPIVQNGKIIGAITHVFISDPTKGYGIYSDWMLEQLNNQ